MLKRDELADPNSCWNRAKEDEIVFVLLGRDVAFPRTLREWVAERIAKGKNRFSDSQIRSALNTAELAELGLPAPKSRLAVGVSVLLTRDKKLLLGRKKNNTGLLSTPGGRIELNEDMYGCAGRETLEATGLTAKNFKVIGFREHFRYGDHYIMFYLHSSTFEGRLENREPEKCEGWEWKYYADIHFSDTTEPASILQQLEFAGDLA